MFKSEFWRQGRPRFLAVAMAAILLVGGTSSSQPQLASDSTFSDTAVVVLDNHPLRPSRQAAHRPLADYLVLNKGDQVRVLSRKNGWAQILTPEEVSGVLKLSCLKPAPDVLRPEPLPESLRMELEDFLRRLREAVVKRQFELLAPLLEPSGLILQGQFFPDAAREPSSQQPRPMPLWYASDVSLTLGTAWEVLMTGTDPAPVQLGFDELTGSWQVLPPGTTKKIMAVAEKESALLPRHLQALNLDPLAQLVPGFPARIEGVPEPDTFTEDPRSQPLAWVYQVGKERYRLEPYKHVGLVLVITRIPEQGMRLRAVATQTP